MSNKINVKVLSDTALAHFKKNIETITEKIKEFEDNKWIISEFEQPMFVEKKFVFDEFDIQDNLETANKEIDFLNHIKVYETLNVLPRYVLCDERFWLWLELDPFYYVARRMMKINSVSTVNDHWMFGQGFRRGLFFGVLSRCYFRVDLTIDESLTDKYELTKWVVEKPERFRNLSWRSFSSEKHLVRGIIKGEKRAVEYLGKEDSDVYTKIAKFISAELGSVGFLDAYSEKDIEDIIYNKMLELSSKAEKNNETIC